MTEFVSRSEIAQETVHNLRRAIDLHRVLTALEEGGIDALAFKGPTLAALAYERLDRAASSDLDVLVRASAVHAAIDRLETIGYASAPANDTVALAGNNEITLTCENQSDVDLHWQLSPNYFFSFDLDSAFARSQTVHIAGKRFRTLGNEDLLLGLAIHHSRHCWNSMGWIRDIAQLIERQPISWSLAYQIADDARAKRVLNLAVVLAFDLCSVSAPPAILARALNDRVARRMAIDVQEKILPATSDFAGTLPGAWMQMRMFEYWRDRVRYIWRRAFWPNRTDAVSAPAAGPFALSLIRPFRILAKSLAHVLHR